MDLTRTEWIALLTGFPVLVLAGVFVPWWLRSQELPGAAFWVTFVLILVFAAAAALLAARLVARSSSKNDGQR